MKKQVFLYFLTIFIIIQISFYLSNGFAREKERQGFQACWSGSRILGRQTWLQECNDVPLFSKIKKIIKEFMEQINLND